MTSIEPTGLPADHIPRTAEQLIGLCSGQTLPQAESMARRYVADHADDPHGWRVLIHCVAAGGNHAETVRLCRLAGERTADSPDVRDALLQALLALDRAGDARQLLRERAATHQPMSPDELRLLAELESLDQPAVAADLYAWLLERQPGDPALRLALRGATARRRQPHRTPAVAFLLTENWHAWIQSPVAEALDALDVPYAVMTHPGAFRPAPPRVVILSDPVGPAMLQLRDWLPRSITVNTRHGVSVNGKNFGLYSAAACDFTCVSSEAAAADIGRLALLPGERLWVTGYPQMDGLFRRLAARDPRAPAGSGRRVLFAPTYNEHLSAADLIGDDPVRAIRGVDETIEVWLAPHPHLRRDRPDLPEAWHRLARQHPRVHCLDGGRAMNLIDRLADVDLLISDVSSVATQYLATGRPLVRLVDVERARRSGAYAPGSVEWALADTARNVSDPTLLAAAVRAGLSDPEPETAVRARQRLSAYLFGELTDGRAGERIAEHVVSRLLANP